MSPSPASLPVDGRDPEVFARLWARVSRPGATPIIPLSAQTPPPEVPAVPAVQPEPAPGAHVEPQEAGLQDVPCLGRASAVHIPLLQEQIRRELATVRFYQVLSRRVPTGMAAALAALSAQELSHAKRLSAACFLISGVRYWPERSAPAPRGAWMSLLRQAFAAEQRAAGGYRAAAAETADPALRALYEEVSGDEARHAGLLLALLERL